MIVSPRGKENLVEIRELLATAPGTRFVFLVPALPPRAPLARVVGEYGSTILWKDEARVVIVSTLVALLASLGYRDEERATG